MDYGAPFFYPLGKDWDRRKSHLLHSIYQNPPSTFASGGQNPFYKKGFGFPKIFYKSGARCFLIMALKEFTWPQQISKGD